ncbi:MULTISPECIES: trigger factor [Clostridium]|jgi:trigger factor|uniref:Trigger factor n=2 Tax=Clostridium beijerinckii TaxID=1520 RepID=TIG_CLOB8|nr:MULTISPECIES: trigger factor [Clostridium]A6LT26.1 RecName: Full=Trigger factor; Short=TF; AltName: Full=PPIase [Clostridium beijerinckii NCIMB 8052]ABR33506.1 trigger factor [Clostridium beijerinckii NCIMB 8052]AIU00437.1 trigger factor [Clostridium beijerinckii ATCC 35702]AJG98073.1 trigger factor [Clostridium beijerinckii]AQS03977.1 trigger factor [Clostridium beijerinckii]MBA2884140.1 trigger factor [Clostridium beijerinckii]
MKAKVEKIETNVIKLEIRVEAEKFDAALTKAYNKNKGRYNIPGFRKGKVPMAMVKKFYGVEVFYDDAVNFAIDESYPEALNAENIKPVDYPQVDIVELGEGKELVYTATVTTYPEVELGEYKGLDIKKPIYEVEDTEIDKQIKEMQEKNARIEVKTEGNIAKGDIAVIDFKGYIDGVAFEGGEGSDYSLEIGSGTFIDNFEEQLIGLAVGDKKEVNVTFPEAYGKEELNGKPAMFEVEIKSIKVKELPELDDEFAKDVSAVDTFAELKENLKKTLEKNNDEKAEREFEEAVITAVIENSKMDIPEVMVNKEIDAMMQDLEGRLKYQGLSLEQYMEFTGNTTEKMRDFMKENAERKVKADLVLEAIAKTEEIKATEEELNARALELGKIYGPKDPEKMAKILVKSQRNMIEKDIILENTLKFLKENCK